MLLDDGRDGEGEKDADEDADEGKRALARVPAFAELEDDGECGKEEVERAVCEKRCVSPGLPGRNQARTKLTNDRNPDAEQEDDRLGEEKLEGERDGRAELGGERGLSFSLGEHVKLRDMRLTGRLRQGLGVRAKDRDGG